MLFIIESNEQEEEVESELQPKVRQERVEDEYEEETEESNEEAEKTLNLAFKKKTKKENDQTFESLKLTPDIVAPLVEVTTDVQVLKEELTEEIPSKVIEVAEMADALKVNEQKVTFYDDVVNQKVFFTLPKEGLFHRDSDCSRTE